MVTTNRQALQLCARHFINMIQVFYGFTVVISLRPCTGMCGVEAWKDVESLHISYDRVHGVFSLEKRLAGGAFTMEFSKEHPMRWVRALDAHRVRRIRLEGQPTSLDPEAANLLGGACVRGLPR